MNYQANARLGAISPGASNPVSQLMQAKSRLQDSVARAYSAAQAIVGPIPGTTNGCLRPVSECPSLMDRVTICADDLNVLASTLDDATAALESAAL